MNSREIAKRAVREQIAHAALKRFKKQGFDETTVDEIAGDIGISTRTYFRYFRSKDEVLLEPTYEFKFRFLEAFEEGVRKHDLWKTLTIVLEETALPCTDHAGAHGTLDAQAIVRETPALLSRQLALMEHLQIEATDLYLAQSTKDAEHGRTITNAVVRSAFACLSAFQYGKSVGTGSVDASASFQMFMESMRPSALKKLKSL